MSGWLHVPVGYARLIKMSAFTISRTFYVPRSQVFEAWTTPELFEKWFAPDECETKLLYADLSVGGHFLQSDRWQDDSHFHVKHTFQQVNPIDRLVFVSSFCTEKGEIVKHPHAAAWPERMLTSVTLEDDGAGTKVTVEWDPLEPSAEETALFAQMLPNCRDGWTGTFDRLQRQLDELTP